MAKKMIDITPALSMKLFHKEKPKRWGLMGTLIATNLIWLTVVGSMAVLFLSAAKFGEVAIQQYIEGRTRWLEIKAAKELAISQRDNEIARMIAFQSSSPGDVVFLAKTISRIIETAGGRHRTFLEQALPEAIRIQARYNIPASAVLSMAIHESNYGASELSKNYNNFFGIKAFSNWPGPRAASMQTRDSGVLTRADFRAYPSMKDGFQGFVEFISASTRYEKAFQETSGPRFVQRLLEGGYCPDNDYLGLIENLMERHHLTELDNVLTQGKDSMSHVALAAPDEPAKRKIPVVVEPPPKDPS